MDYFVGEIEEQPPVGVLAGNVMFYISGRPSHAQLGGAINSMIIVFNKLRRAAVLRSFSTLTRDARQMYTYMH